MIAEASGLAARCDHRQWDALVIGAGPAGSAAAIELARGGLSTLLVDRARFPREKVCGGCLNRRAMVHLAQLGLQLPAPAKAHVTEERQTAHFSAAGAGVASCTSVATASADAFVLAAAGRRCRLQLGVLLAVQRDQLDAVLAELAVAAGAEFESGVTARVRVREGQSPQVELTFDDRPAVVQPRWIVVADGLGSPSMSRASGFRALPARTAHVGLGGTFFGEAADPAVGELLMAVHAEGYVGQVRLADGRVNLAAALAPALLRRCGGLRDAVDCVLRSAGVHSPPELANALLRATPSLTRRPARFEQPGVFLAGDAAGYIEPFTGEGIGWALEGGRQAAAHILRLSRGQTVGLSWTAQRLRSLRQRWLCRALATGLRHPTLVQASIWALGHAAGLARPLVRRWNSAPELESV